MNVELTAPTHYGELTDNQLRFVVNLKIAGNDEADLWRKCLIKFTGIQPAAGDDDRYYFTKKGVKEVFSLKLEELNYFAKQLSWLTKDYSGINPPRIAGLKPVDNLLRDTLFEQYLEAENYYEAYIFTQEEENLMLMIAILYQQADRYHSRNNEKIMRRIRKRITPMEQLICFMWMLGVKQHFAEKWKYLFPRQGKKNDDEELVIPDMEKIVRGQMRMLTNGDVTKEEKVLKSQTWSALDELNEQCRENDLKKR